MKTSKLLVSLLTTTLITSMLTACNSGGSQHTPENTQKLAPIAAKNFNGNKLDQLESSSATNQTQQKLLEYLKGKLGQPFEGAGGEPVTIQSMKRILACTSVTALPVYGRTDIIEAKIFTCKNPNIMIITDKHGYNPRVLPDHFAKYIQPGLKGGNPFLLLALKTLPELYKIYQNPENQQKLFGTPISQEFQNKSKAAFDEYMKDPKHQQDLQEGKVTFEQFITGAYHIFKGFYEGSDAVMDDFATRAEAFRFKTMNLSNAHEPGFEETRFLQNVNKALIKTKGDRFAYYVAQIGTLPRNLFSGLAASLLLVRPTEPHDYVAELKENATQEERTEAELKMEKERALSRMHAMFLLNGDSSDIDLRLDPSPEVIEEFKEIVATVSSSAKESLINNVE